MYGSMPPNYSPLGANVGGGALGNMLLTLLMPMLQSQMSQFGMTPSQLLPAQNMYDQMQGRRYQEGQQLAMQMGAQRDAQTYKQFFSGAYTAAGMDPTAGRAPEHIKTLSNDVAMIAPFLAAIAPDQFDAMHGRRGSALVMAQAVHRAGQHVIDPTTGRMRMRGETAGRMTSEIFDTLYGPGMDITQMNGISAGQSGMLFEELTRRGMVDKSIGTQSRAEQTQSIRGMKMTDADYERIAARVAARENREVTPADVSAARAAHQTPFSGTQEMSDEMLTMFDAGKIKNRVKNMSSAVAAMRDIFGDAGNPNAPLAELMQALDQLTQGSLATKSPAQIEHTIRNIHQLSKTAGVSMEATLGLAAHGAGMADRFGLDRSFVPQLLQSTLAFGAAANATGMFATPAWGASDKEKMTLMHNQLSISAAASPNVNRINALIHMSDYGMIDESTEAGKKLKTLAEAAKRGDAAALSSSEILDETKFRKLAAEAGVDGYAFQSIIGAPAMTQESGNAYNTGKLGFEMQYKTDITPSITQAFGSQLTTTLNAGGVTDPQKISNAVGRRVAEAMQDPKQLSNETMSDSQSRNKALMGVIRQALKDEGVDGMFTEQDIAAAASGGWGQFDRDRRRYGSSGIDTFRMYNPETISQMNIIAQDAAIEAQTASALSGAGSAGPMRNFVDAVMEAKPGVSGEALLYKVFGGTEGRFSGKPLTPAAETMREAKRLQETAERGPDGRLTEKGAAQYQRGADIMKALIDGKATPEEIEKLAGGNAAVSAGLVQSVKSHGLQGMFRESGINPDEIPAPYLNDEELKKQMPAEQVRDKIAGLISGENGAAKEALTGILQDGGRHAVGARALRSRAALLELAKRKGYVTGEGAEAERAGIDKLLKSGDLTDAERTTVKTHEGDYSIIADVGTEAMDEAHEIREKLGTRMAAQAGTTKITGTVTMVGVDKAVLALVPVGDAGNAGFAPTAYS